MKTMRPMNIESFPDDVLVKIFVDHLSAEEIYESARLVCRKWYHLTNTNSFIHSHLRRTEHVLVFKKNGFMLGDSFSLSLRHGRVEMSKFRYKFRGLLFHGGCSGLVLGRTPSNEGRTYFFANPITNRRYVLPSTTGGINFWRYCISYAAPSMVHKVVATPRPDPPWARRGPPNSTQVVESCRILTVGVDNSWRSVPIAHLTYASKIAFFPDPLVTEGGFVHWCVERSNQVWTLNIETEVIKETPPPFPEVDGQRRAYLSTGKYLSVLVSCGEYLWEVWEMKPQTGEWRKVTNFSLEDVRSMFEPFGFGENEYIAPIGWLMYPQVLVFGFSNGYQPQVFPYNLVTQKIDSIKLLRPLFSFTRFLHQGSLVRI